MCRAILNSWIKQITYGLAEPVNSVMASHREIMSKQGGYFLRHTDDKFNFHLGLKTACDLKNSLLHEKDDECVARA